MYMIPRVFIREYINRTDDARFARLIERVFFSKDQIALVTRQSRIDRREKLGPRLIMRDKKGETERRTGIVVAGNK